MKKIFNRYAYRKNEDGKWNWNFKGRNNKIQFFSNQGHETERDCIRACKAARRNSLFSIIRREQ